MDELSFDIRFCVAYINECETFTYRGFDWTINAKRGKNITVESEYWDKGIPHSYLFKPENDTGSRLKLNDNYKQFRTLELIEGDTPYRILSTLHINYKYKWLLYALVRLPRAWINRELATIKSEGDKIYDELKEYIELYEGSPLLYELEEQRQEKIKKSIKKKEQKALQQQQQKKQRGI